MENQPAPRPWFRLVSQIRRDPLPQPPPAVPQLRPPLILPPTTPIRPSPPPTLPPPPPQPQPLSQTEPEPQPPQLRSPIRPPTQVPPPPPSPKLQTSPPSRVPASSPASPPPPSPPKVPAPSSNSLPPSPVAPKPSYSLLPPSPTPAKTVPSPPPAPKASSLPSPPPAPNSVPPSQVTTTTISPPRQRSPKIIVQPSTQTPPPPQSPKTKLSAPPPSPLSLPPSQLLKPDTEPPVVAEKKSGVVVQEEKLQMPGATKTTDGLNNGKFGGGTSRDLPIKDKYKDKEKGRMRVITLAGENKGAYMEITSSNKKKPDTVERTGIHGQKLGSTSNSSSSSSSSDEDRKSVMEDKKVTRTPSRAFVNSNAQAINNSILFNSSFTHHDPGVHLVLPAGKPKHLPGSKDDINGHKKEFHNKSKA